MIVVPEDVENAKRRDENQEKNQFEIKTGLRVRHKEEEKDSRITS